MCDVDVAVLAQVRGDGQLVHPAAVAMGEAIVERLRVASSRVDRRRIERAATIVGDAIQAPKAPGARGMKPRRKSPDQASALTDRHRGGWGRVEDGARSRAQVSASTTLRDYPDGR
jgi:hypothetical protein